MLNVGNMPKNKTMTCCPAQCDTLSVANLISGGEYFLIEKFHYYAVRVSWSGSKLVMLTLTRYRAGERPGDH